MTDISKCDWGCSCPQKNKCYRYTCDVWILQSWCEFWRDMKEDWDCSYFYPLPK